MQVQQRGIVMQVVDGVFAIALVAMIAINYDKVSTFLTGLGTGYSTVVKGLQGR